MHVLNTYLRDRMDDLEFCSTEDDKTYFVASVVTLRKYLKKPRFLVMRSLKLSIRQSNIFENNNSG